MDINLQPSINHVLKHILPCSFLFSFVGWGETDNGLVQALMEAAIHGFHHVV
jgi:hypothetical protein